MKKILQGLITGIIIGAILTSGVALADNIQETIRAVYMNIKLVVDGEEIIPKDENGNVVEPFIYNGTTYLPVRAVGKAFNKDVNWDGDTATVYIGDIVKPAKSVYLFNKPYIACDIPAEFSAGEKDQNHSNYILFNLQATEKIDYSNYEYHNSVTYSLNGVTKKIKGTFIAPEFSNCSSAEYQVNFYDEKGKLLNYGLNLTAIQIGEPINLNAV